MNYWSNSLLAVMIVSLLSFTGALFLVVSKKVLANMLFILVSFSAGSLLGGAFIHLLPEVINEVGFTHPVSLSVLAGLLLFFVLEKFVCWRHCHILTSAAHPHPVGIISLIGDSLHNFIDGMVIAGSFLVDASLGWATLLAVIFHEIPQEIGDLGVLLYAGYSKAKALVFNFISALMAVLGAILVLIIGRQTPGLTQLILPFTAGGFIYIAGSDLIPELHKQVGIKKSLLQLTGLILGIGVMLLLR